MADRLIGEKLGQYRVEKLLAIGGMARIYVATDELLERPVAVKVLEIDDEWVDDTIETRFIREAKTIAAINHDNIVSIYQYGAQDNVYWFAMPYIEGKDLSRIIKDYRMKGQNFPIERALNLMEQVAKAIDFAHSKGIIHRDIKPSNVLLTEDDKAILTDFGLILRPNIDVTHGKAFGTPRYISPEQATTSHQVVPASDIYSFAVILYEMLVGSTPFDSENPMEIAIAHVSESPPNPNTVNPNLPEDLNDIFRSALSKSPNERPKSATALIQAVREAFKLEDNEATPHLRINQPPPRNNSRAYIMGLSIVLAIVVVIGIIFFMDPFGLRAEKTTSGMIDSTDGTVVPTAQAMTLIYNENAVFILNSGEADIPLEGLWFVRGTPNKDNDDWSPTVFRQETLNIGSCMAITLEDSNTPEEPEQCRGGATPKQEITGNPLPFWHTTIGEGTIPAFTIMLDNRLLGQCNTVARGSRGLQECRITLVN